MSKDLKDIINTVEKETKSEAELEATINSLNEEINKLKTVIKEQKMIINEQSDSIAMDVGNIPSEDDILKEMIISQRQALIEKDESNEKLHDQIDELIIKLENSGNGTFNKQINDDLVQAQELILAFTEESENFRNEIEGLQNQINSMKSETNELKNVNLEQMEENDEMVNIKRLNFQLMEENGLLRIEIESLKVRLQEQIEEMSSEELQLAYKKIEVLTTELEDYDAQVHYLQQKLETDIVTPVSLTYTTDEFNNLKEELLRYQNEDKRLKNILTELDHGESSENEYTSVIFNFPKQFQISLFKRMYNLLDETDKKEVINSLIKDLDNRNCDVKRAVLKILGEIRDEKVYEAFLDLLHDEDWVIRYNVIKALTSFGFNNRFFKDLLKKLTKDMDIDVRELAMKVLGEIS